MSFFNVKSGRAENAHGFYIVKIREECKTIGELRQNPEDPPVKRIPKVAIRLGLRREFGGGDVHFAFVVFGRKESHLDFDLPLVFIFLPLLNFSIFRVFKICSIIYRYERATSSNLDRDR